MEKENKNKVYQRSIENILKQADREKVKDNYDKFNKLMAYYRCAMMEIETKFNVLNEEFSLRYDRNPINGMKSRLKNPISIKEKFDRKNIPFSVDDLEDNINDIAGIRVICSFPDDVYMLGEPFKTGRYNFG